MQDIISCVLLRVPSSLLWCSFVNVVNCRKGEGAHFFPAVRGCPRSCAGTNPWFRGRILGEQHAQEPPPGSAVKRCRFLGTGGGGYDYPALNEQTETNAYPLSPNLDVCDPYVNDIIIGTQKKEGMSDQDLIVVGV